MRKQMTLKKNVPLHFFNGTLKIEVIWISALNNI